MTFPDSVYVSAQEGDGSSRGAVKTSLAHNKHLRLSHHPPIRTAVSGSSAWAAEGIEEDCLSCAKTFINSFIKFAPGCSINADSKALVNLIIWGQNAVFCPVSMMTCTGWLFRDHTRTHWWHYGSESIISIIHFVCLKVVYLTNSGSEANDLAMLMARLHTGNFDIITFRYPKSCHIMMISF